MSNQPAVYILGSRRYGTLYIDGPRTCWRVSTSTGSEAYRASLRGTGWGRLLRYELFADMPTATAREKPSKAWRRDWKINLIESDDPHLNDLAVALEPLGERLRHDGS